MILSLYFLLSANSCYFLRLSAGVMSQALGGSSIMFDEGLSAFHNPALAEKTRFNFTLSRWLYSTDLLAFGSTYKKNSIAVSYLGYGTIQGLDALGRPTNEFIPYDLIIGLGRKFGKFGVLIKGFQERIDAYSLYGLCCGFSSYLDFDWISLGAKIDNLGKEFTQDAIVPFTTSTGIKFSLPEDIDLILETKTPDFVISLGSLYRYHNLKIIFGIRYLMPGSGMESRNRLNFSDFSFSAGTLMAFENYEIGYSFVYNQFSTAHQFAIIFEP